jgi:hypothetical protein
VGAARRREVLTGRCQVRVVAHVVLLACGWRAGSANDSWVALLIYASA